MRHTAEPDLAERAHSAQLVTRTFRSRPPARKLQQRNERVLGHLDLIDHVARHYAARCRERTEDLQQVAALGLIRAAERYDSSTNIPFAAFARPHVRGAVLHYLRDVAPLLRVSRRLQERTRLVEQARRDAGSRAETLRDEDLQRELGFSDRQWQALQWTAREACVRLLPPLMLQEEQQRRDDSGLVSSDALGDGDSGALTALRGLSQRQRFVVEAVVLQGQSLRAVAKRQGSSAATMHRVLHQALAELRRQLSPAFAAPGC